MKKASSESSADSQSASEPLPAGWTRVALGNLGLGRTEGIEPAEEPDTLFELWSVPSFPTGQPEQVLGSTIGSNKQRVAEGDVLLCKINPRINRVWRVGPASGLPQIASTEWIVFRSPAFDPAFLMWRFRENKFRAALCANMTGVGGSLTRARPKDVAQIEIALPPLPEQRRIVARLEALEARSRRAREKLAEVPAQLAQARQSLLAAAFRGTLTADWRKATASAWRRSPLAGLVVKMGSGATPRGGRESYQADGVPLIRSMNVRFEGFTDDGLAFLDDEQADALKSVEVKTGDVLFNITGASIGRVCTAPSKMEGARVNQHVMRIRPTAELNGEFLAAYLASPEMQGFVFQNETGTTRQALTKGQIESFLIPLPPLAEQHEIVRRLNAAFARLDAAAAAHAAAVAELDRLDQSLLARAFSGGLVAQSAAVATTVPAAPSPRSALKPKSYLTQLVPALLRVHGRSLALDQINSALALLHSPRAARDRVFRELGALEALEYFTGWSQTHEDGALTAAINDLLKIGTLSQTKDRESHTMLHLVGKLPPIAPEVETDARHIATFIEHIPARAPDVAPAVSNRAAASSPRSRGQTRLKTQTPV